MRRILLVLIFALLLGVIFLVERRVSTGPVGLGAIMRLIADFQRQAERVPLTVTRISDKEEQEIGSNLAQCY